MYTSPHIWISLLIFYNFTTFARVEKICLLGMTGLRETPQPHDSSTSAVRSSNTMCGLFHSLRSAVMSHFLKQKDTIPEPVGSFSDADASEHGPSRGITKVPQDMMEDVLSCLDRMIQNETKNPGRRENMQIGKDFVREHGWPEEDYCIWVLKGVVLVLTEEQMWALPKSPARADAFVLVSNHKLAIICVVFFETVSHNLSCSVRLSRNVFDEAEPLGA